MVTASFKRRGIVKNFIRGLAFAIVSICAFSTSALASVYTFTATCTDCSNVLGTLTLKDYTPGTQLQDSNFVSLVYSSSVISPALDIEDAHISGVLPENGTARFAFDGFSATGLIFDGHVYNEILMDTFVDGSWSIGPDASVLDFGPSHNFALQAAVPEPSTWMTLLLGFCGLGLLARRRRHSGVLGSL
jgi:hypothetical protein